MEASKSATHTHTPWVAESLVNPSARTDDRHYIWRDTDPQVADPCVAIVCAQSDAMLTDANAAFIVRACNSHDELVAALRKTVESIEREKCARLLTSARAALAKASAP